MFAIPRKHAVGAQRCGGDGAAEALARGAESLLEIAFASETGWKITADDEVVDVIDQVFNAGVSLIEIGDDGNSGGAGPRCSLGCGGCFETVHVEGAGIDDPRAIELAGLEQQAFVA